MYGWITDYAAPSDFLSTLFSCASLVPNAARDFNVSGFCDPTIDARMRRAAALQIVDPARAGAAWGGVDRALTDRAVVIAFANPTLGSLTSARVGNFQVASALGPLFSLAWVR